jgi:DNA-binding NtrC family response regulator
MAAAATFRQNLFFRLAAFELKLPPLREIPEDLPHIAQYWLDHAAVRNGKAKRFSSAALATMRWYGWPGNVRELRNVVERAKILCDGQEIADEHLNLPSLPGGGTGSASTADFAGAAAAAPVSLAEMEWRLIQHALRFYGGNKTAAARSLGISLRTLYNKLEAKSAHTAGTASGIRAGQRSKADPPSPRISAAQRKKEPPIPSDRGFH